MADPKGTYFGPGERGLATVLPSSPNFAGLAQMASNANLRRQRFSSSISDLKEKERQAAIGSVSSMLQKGHTTGLIFQNELNKRVQDGIAKLSELASGRARSEEIRSFGASLGQELVTYAKSGQQVTSLIDEMRKWNQGNGKMIDEGVLMSDISSRLIGDDNKLRDPSDISPDELAVENIVFGDKDGAGAKYLIKGKVISNLIKSPELKAAVVENRDFEDASGLPAGKVGTVETIRKEKLPPFATVNQITGEVEIMDAERLVKSPIWQVLLNDRAFMTLVENEVSKAYAPKDSPSSVFIKGVMGGAQEVFLPKKENASPEELEEMRGKAAVALLQGTQFAGAQVVEERRLRMQNRFQARASGAPTVEQQKYAGEERWMNYVLSGNASKINQALAFTENKGEVEALVDIAFDERVDRVEATNDGFIFKIIKTRQDGTPRKDQSGDVLYRMESKLISEIDPEKLRNFYRMAAFKSKRNFGSNERGEKLTNEPTKESPIFVNPKIKK